ncbi:lipopolysaccharide export system permease protein [Bacteroidales bacterium WCE2004]|nr:lipopolysaccharide export system permease protein [Bacteroidales bacterium WCE2004]
MFDKITKIDWYIAKKFISTFFLSMVLIIVVIIIFDLSEKIDYFVKNEAPLKAIVFDYYCNYIPYMINMFASLFVFITVIFFTSRMASNSEIIAILSCGVRFHRMMVPYIASATLIALLSLGLNLYVIPHSNATRIEFEAKYIKRHNNFNLRNIHYQISPGKFVYIESFSRWNNTAYKFTIEDMEGHRLVRKISAESAAWDSTTTGWQLRKVITRDYSTGLKDDVRYADQVDTVIGLKLKDLFNNEKTVETLAIGALDELIETQKLRGDPNVMYARIEKQRRLTMPFSAIILTIIGVSLSARKRRGGIGWNIGIGIGLAFSYIFFLRMSEMFVYTDTLPPGIALWLPNLLFAGVAYFLYKRACK